jgi:peptidoglycan/LPS O-acetylase OafA/YrhL
VKDLPALTGMRWVAAFLVFGYHLWVIELFAPTQAGATILRWLFQPGSVGVSFFVILSGVVLMWSSPTPTCRRFWWRRFARVYPLHLATAGIVVLLLWTGILGNHMSWGAAAANLLLVQSWSPDITYVQSLNTVSWTLSCEAFFYLLFPLITHAFAGPRRRGLTAAAVAAAAAAVATLGPLAGHLVADPETVAWFFHWNPLGRLPEFVLGVALAVLVRVGHRRQSLPLRALWAAAAILTIAGYLLAPATPEALRTAACTLPGFALVLVAAALSDLEGRPTLWRHPVLVRLGEMSFAFYLIHLIVIRVQEVVVGYHPRLGNGPAFALATSTLAVSVAAAWLLHEYVERPARTLLLRPQAKPVTP